MSWLVYSLALSAYYTLHSLMASKFVKSIFSKAGINDQIYRILFNSIALGTTAIMYHLFQATHTDLDQFGSPVGGGLIIIGLVLVVRSLIDYNILVFAGLKKEAQSDELVTTGLNRYLRHPLYLGIIIALAGWNIVYISGAALATLIITICYVQIGIYLEEKKLIDQYGDQYKKYQNEVPKLIPRFWK